MSYTWTSEDAPYPYQVVGADLAVSSKYVIIADEMGLGKTWQAILATTKLKIPTLVVAPASLCFNWREEFRNLTDCRVYTFSPKSPAIPTDAEVMIVSSSQLSKAEHLFAWAKFRVIDECQQFKNLDTLRTKLLHGYMKKYPTEYHLELSGTPIKNRVSEFYPALLRLAADRSNNHKISSKYPSFYTYCHRFTNIIQKRYGGQSFPTYSGHKNVDELRTYLKGRYIRRLVDKVLNLPEENFLNIAAEYKEDPGLAELWKQFQHAPGMVKDVTAKRQTAVAKAKFTAEYARTVFEGNEGSPVIVVSDHVEPVRIIALELSESFRVAAVDGSTPSGKRAEFVSQFQNGQLDFLVMTIGSMSVGHTLTRANHMVINDSAWVPAENAQVRARIRRIGQTKRVFFHHITGGVMDRHISRMLQSKEDTIKAVLN